MAPPSPTEAPGVVRPAARPPPPLGGQAPGEVTPLRNYRSCTFQGGGHFLPKSDVRIGIPKSPNKTDRTRHLAMSQSTHGSAEGAWPRVRAPQARKFWDLAPPGTHIRIDVTRSSTFLSARSKPKRRSSSRNSVCRCRKTWEDSRNLRTFEGPNMVQNLRAAAARGQLESPPQEHACPRPSSAHSGQKRASANCSGCARRSVAFSLPPALTHPLHSPRSASRRALARLARLRHAPTCCWKSPSCPPRPPPREAVAPRR